MEERNYSKLSRKKDLVTGLTPQQEKFCQEYVASGQTYKAYLIAYPNSKNWKPATVYNASSILLDKPEIQSRLNVLMNENNKKYRISTNKVICEIVKMFENCNNPAERQTAFKCINLLARIVGIDNPAQININNNIQINNNTTNNIDKYLNLE